MRSITPMLWFDDRAEEAANFYVEVFSGRPGGGRAESKVTDVTRYGEAGPGRAGDVMVVAFELEGQRFTALNGGEQPFHFSEAISFVVDCPSQEEVDYFWDALRAGGGEESVCGWLKDRFGVSWQVTPTEMEQILGGPDREAAERATRAMLQMRKIDVAELRRAAAGE